MTPEQMERTIQFILEAQAQLTANMQKHDELIVRHDEAIASHDEAIASHDEAIARHDQEIQTVTDLIGRLALAETNLVAQMNRLAEAQAETTERLNAFITFVEKYISSRNGGPQPAPS
jgi:prefoldin subunit 5